MGSGTVGSAAWVAADAGGEHLGGPATAGRYPESCAGRPAAFGPPVGAGVAVGVGQAHADTVSLAVALEKRSPQPPRLASKSGLYAKWTRYREGA
jgi:hypothetical protein